MADEYKGIPPFEAVGNMDTMNLHNILYQNIIASPYFKSLYEKKAYNKVIDEIYDQVTSLVPFFKDTHASTAFCLLYKLWTLKLNARQIQILIMHPDSPYIRALGFLYLRYLCKPAYLWGWYCNWLDDEEKVQIDNKPKPRIITIGRLCRVLLTEPKWLGTMLPRIPVPIAREISSKLKLLEPSLAPNNDQSHSSGRDNSKTNTRHQNRVPRYPGPGTSSDPKYSHGAEFRSYKRKHEPSEYSHPHRRRHRSPDRDRSPPRRHRDYSPPHSGATRYHRRRERDERSPRSHR